MGQVQEPVPGACSRAAHVGCVAGGVACPRSGAFRGEGARWRPLRPVDGVVQRFPGCFWGVGDGGGKLQAVPSAWWGWDFVVGGVCRCPSDLAVVVPFHCPPDVLVFEDVDLCGGRGGVHGVPAEELDGADHGLGLRGCSRAEDLVDVLCGRASVGGILNCLGQKWEGAVLPGAGGGHRGVHGCDQDVLRQPFHHEVVFPLQVSGDGGFRL